jgi:hypothetical protein
MSYLPGAGFPPLADVRAWIQVPATVLTDAQLDLIAAGEQAAVTAGYDWTGTLPDNLVAVFMRLVARATAAKGVSLGLLAADAEYGGARLSRWDAEVTRLGGANRKRTFA